MAKWMARLTVLAVFALMAAGALVAAQESSGPGMMGGMGRMGMMGGPAFVQRHRTFMRQGVPAPYAGLRNPLPDSPATLRRGAELYQANCSACHGVRGRGDGDAGKGLHPPPAALDTVARMPMPDSFFYWTIAEGGAPFGTAMPAFRDTLGRDDIWAVIAYLRAGLPEQAAAPPAR